MLVGIIKDGTGNVFKTKQVSILDIATTRKKDVFQKKIEEFTGEPRLVFFLSSEDLEMQISRLEVVVYALLLHGIDVAFIENEDSPISTTTHYDIHTVLYDAETCHGTDEIQFVVYIDRKGED